MSKGYDGDGKEEITNRLFWMEIDTFYVISEILKSLECFFSELKRIQGHTTFY